MSISRSPIPGSPILGTMRFGAWGADLDAGAVARLLNEAADAGIDTLDLADIYGDHTTNALVGAAFARDPGLRRRFALVAKVGIVRAQRPGNALQVAHYDLSVRHLRDALAETLRTLGVDTVDTLMLHRFDPLLQPEAIAEWIRSERDAGRVGAFGVSNFGAHALALFDGRLSIAANQIELSLWQPSALESGDLDASRARGAVVQAWSPLGGGGALDADSARERRIRAALDRLADMHGTDPATLALRWVATVPQTRVVLGSSRIDRIRQAIGACAAPLPHDAWYALWEAARGHAVP